MSGRQEITGIDGDYCVYPGRLLARDRQQILPREPLQPKRQLKITNTADASRAACIDGGYIVYEGYVGPGNPEIFLDQIATGETTRLTQNDYPDKAPDVGGGFVTLGGERRAGARRFRPGDLPLRHRRYE